MRSLRIVLLAAATALVFAPAALAKGPSKAEVNGPGLKHAIVLEANGFNGGGDAGPGTPLGDFTQEVGFFPAAYQQSPSPMRPTRPKGTLGPKYRVTYTVPDGS